MSVLTREQAEATVKDMETFEAGESIDVSTRTGLLVSSKDAYVTWDQYPPNAPHYQVLHNIDGTVTEFTRNGFIEVLMGTRSPWDSDMEPQPDTNEEVRTDE